MYTNVSCKMRWLVEVRICNIEKQHILFVLFSCPTVRRPESQTLTSVSVSHHRQDLGLRNYKNFRQYSYWTSCYLDVLVSRLTIRCQYAERRRHQRRYRVKETVQWLSVKLKIYIFVSIIAILFYFGILHTRCNKITLEYRKYKVCKTEL